MQNDHQNYFLFMVLEEVPMKILIYQVSQTILRWKCHRKYQSVRFLWHLLITGFPLKCFIIFSMAPGLHVFSKDLGQEIFSYALPLPNIEGFNPK